MSAPSWLEQHLSGNSYIVGYEPTQADVAVYKSLSQAPATPNAARWYKHITSYETEFASLPGDASKPAADYAPSTSAAAPAAAAAADDEDIDLFGSDDDEVDEEAERIKAERLAEYEKKKAGKVKPAAKSIVTLDVKPWDDETDMKALEAAVRSIEQDGLVWGGGKLVPVGYGVFKLQINVVIEDEKISVSDLEEKIQEFEDFVQSTDVAAMQKI